MNAKCNGVSTMSFSNTAGTSIIPTLSRIVLCAAFIPAGYNKLFKEADFSGADADRLIELDIIDAPTQARLSTEPTIILTSWQEVAEDQEAAQPPAEEEPAVTEDDVEAAETASEADAEAEAPSTTGTLQARGVHNVTLMLDNAGWPAPKWLALLAAWTELLGGAFILVGFLSRVWGLGLAIAMGVAFYLTSMHAFGDVGFFNVLFGGNNDVLSPMFAQLGLFVLAIGVFMTGAGPLSLDRALFKKSDEDEEIEYEEE